jgi:hypothetical protein
MVSRRAGGRGLWLAPVTAKGISRAGRQASSGLLTK